MPTLVPWPIPVWLQELQWCPAAHSKWLEQHLAPAPEPLPEATQAVKAPPSTMAWPLELGIHHRAARPLCSSCSCTCAGHCCRHWPVAESLQQVGELQQGTDTALLLKDEFSSFRRRRWASGILQWEILKISSQCSAHLCQQWVSQVTGAHSRPPYTPRGNEITMDTTQLLMHSQFKNLGKLLRRVPP